METFRYAVSFAAPPTVVYRALTTAEGLGAWWTPTCRIDPPAVGGIATFRFGRTFKVMRVEELGPDRLVRWRCIAAHIHAPDQLRRADEWVGTELVFALSPAQSGGTQLAFEHRGLAPAFECFELCVGAWEHFLHSLQRYVDTGIGEPHIEATD